MVHETVHETETRHEVPHNDPKTAPTILFELFAAEDDPQATLDAYRAERARPLLEGGVAWAVNVFRLREQQVPATPLADGVSSGLAAEVAAGLMLLGAGAGPALPTPQAVFAAAYQLPADGPARDNIAAALEAASATDDGGTGRRTISLGAFTKLEDWGRPAPAEEPDGNSAFQSAMIVVTHPTDIGYVDQFNAWYSENHMIDVAKSPPYRSATRYRLARLSEGIPLPYICIYEIEAPYSPQIHQDMMNQVSVLPWEQREPQPTTPGGQGVLTIDFWGYYERAWAEGTPRS